MKRSVLAAGLLFVCAVPFARAQDEKVNLPAVSPTVNLPADCHMWFKLPSLNRLDVLAGKLKPIFKLFDDAMPLSKQVPSKALLSMSGLAETEVDKTRPLIFAVRDGDMIAILPAAPAATFAEAKAINGRWCTRRGPWFVMGEKDDVEAPRADTIVRLPAGDLGVHVAIAALVEKHKKDIDEGFEKIQELPIPVPEKFQALYKEALGVVRSGVDQVASFEYSFSMSKEGRVFSAGRIATKPRSKLREMLRASGKAGSHDLLRFLPRNAFMASSNNMEMNWSSPDLNAMLDKHMGEGASKALASAFGPSSILGPTLGTRSASVTTMGGMFAIGSISISELTDGKKAAELLATFDPAKTNELLTGAEIPVQMTWEKDVFEHEGVAVHRFGYASDNPQFGMILAQSQSLVAIDGNMLIASAGTNAKTALLDLIDRIRADKKADSHPHLEAIQRLGDHNMAFTMNFAALKPFAMIFAMQFPEAAEIMNAIPDQMLMSTAIRMDDGDISWRGEWPINEMKGLLAKVAEMTASKKAKEGLKEAEEEEDFD